MADYVSALTGPEMDEALYDMASHTSEAWAVGERNGTPVTSGDETYNNNSKYWANRSKNYNNSAQAAAARAEAAVPSGTAGAVFFDRAQSLTDGQKAQVKANIGMAGQTNPNLLDNWWWGAVSLVNQRGATSGSFSSNQYFIDRWYLYGAGTYSVTAGGVTFTVPDNASTACLVNQKFPSVNAFSNRVMTASVKIYNGAIYSGTITRTNGTTQHFYTGDDIYITFHQDDMFQIRTRIGSSVTIQAVKLEYGNVSTLAYDSYPSKALEMEKCLYYFERLASSSSNNLTLAIGHGNGSYVFAPISLHPKASTPTITTNGTINIGKNAGSTAVTSLGLYSFSPNGQATLQASATNTSGDVYRIILNSGGYVDFSADL